jgi:hypothetical protein
MQVVASERAREAIERRGGRIYVWVRKGRRCCGGLRTLTTAVEPHPDVEFRRVDAERGFELFLPAQLSPLPDELHLDVRGRARSVDAYWNGCAWIV